MKLIIDLEADGLLYPWDGKVLTQVWCACGIDIETDEEYRWVLSDPDVVKNFLATLTQADLIIGHGLQRYDCRVLERFYGFTPRHILDTKIAASCIYPDLKTDDWRSKLTGKPWREVPTKLMGSHKLQAWGIRLGISKGEFRSYQDTQAEINERFSIYTPEMLEYCMQDCRVTLALYQNLMAQNPSQEMLRLEHEFAAIMDQQIVNGFRLDIEGCNKLVCELQIKRAKLDEELKNLFPPRIIEYATPKKKLPKTKTIIFNPSSRDQITWNFIKKYGWKPVKFCEKNGKPQVDEAVLSELDYPEAKQLIEYLTIEKRLGQIAEGKNAWLKLVHSDGKIHGGVNTNGTVTGRCTFIAPNMGQVPRVGNPYGSECRAVFLPDEGWDLIGCDAAGIQLRLLAHYLARYDGGEYARLVSTGDPHERNRQAFGVPTRDEAKTVLYALLFGASPSKIGRITGRSEGESKDILNSFFRAVPAFKRLRNDIGQAIKVRAHLIGLNGRRYPIRSPHVGLNVLLMGAEGVIMKQATINTHLLLDAKGLEHGKDYKQVVHVYDENQFTAPSRYSPVVGESAAEAIVVAGQQFKLLCPLKGEFKIGKNWAETH